jgi:6-phosphogluconolactonase
MNSSTGVIEDIRLAAQAVNPSYLTLAPPGKYLLAVNETANFNGAVEGAVSAYSIEKDGSLVFINQRPSGGTLPCHVALSGEGKFAVVPNYGSGVLSVFPLGAGGKLGEPCQTIRLGGSGPDRERQQGPHAHFFMFDKKFRRGFACDLGTDRVMAYEFDAAAETPLKPNGVPWHIAAPGAGPRHGAFSPSGKYAYILSEMGSTLEVLSYDSRDGSFETIQILSVLPKGSGVNSTAAALKLGAGGAFVYASNRGHDSIAVFRVTKTGTLEFSGALSSGGRTPRDFTVDPSGKFLVAANQDSDNLAVFRIDPKTGLFKKEREYPVPAPVCIIWS